MKWEDEGMVLASRPHGERNSIIEVFTRSKGRHLGLLRNISSRKYEASFEPGAQVNVMWTARLEEHLGVFSVEVTKNRTLNLIENKKGLLGFNAMASMLLLVLPERAPVKQIYYRTINLIDSIDETSDWLADYIGWELFLLSELGYGLDLSSCVVTGVKSDLNFVSPKSGRAVCDKASEGWKHKLLPLPKFLVEKEAPFNKETLFDGFSLTGYFLHKWLFSSLNIQTLPESRNQFLKAIFN